MYGLIILTVRDLVLTKYGSKMWKKICSAAGAPEVYVMNQPYDDKHLYSIIAAASKLLGVNIPDLVEVAGYWFTVYVKTTEYAKLLSMAGPTFALALRNISQLHSVHIRQYFPQLAMPIVRCNFETETQARIQYSPTRETRVGLGALLVGIIKGWAENDYGIRSISITQEKRRDQGAPFDEYLIAWDATDVSSDTSDNESGASVRVPEPRMFVAPNPRQFVGLFPFHIAFDQTLAILQVAPSMSKLVPAAAVGKRFDRVFDVMLTGGVAAPAEWAFKDAKQWEYEMVTIQLAQAAVEGGKARPQLKGQFLVMREPVKCIVFVGSPVIRDVSDAQKLGLALSDFALHDPTKDALFMTDARAVNEAVTAAKKHKSSHSKRDKDRQKAVPNPNTSNLLESLIGSKLKPFKNTPTPLRRSDSFANVTSVSGISPSPSNKSTALADLDTKESLSLKSQLGLLSMCPVAGRTSGSISARPTDDIHKRFVDSPIPIFTGRPATQFCEVLIEDSSNKFELALSLLRHASQLKDRRMPDELLPALLQFYDSRGATMGLLRTVLDQELISTQQGADDSGFLRSNDLPGRVCTTYFQLHGGSAFLRSVLQPLFSSIESGPESPDAKQISALTTQLFTAVDLALHNGSFPRALWQVLGYVYQSGVSASLRRPLEGVVSLLFLRYLHVALVSPEQFSVATRALSGPSQRVAVQLAKHAQLVVNACLQSERMPTAVATEHQRLVEKVLIRLSDLCARQSYSMNPAFAEGANQTTTHAALHTAVSTIRDFLLENAEPLLEMSQKSTPLRRAVLALMKVALTEVA